MRAKRHAALVGAFVVLAACGDDDDRSSKPEDPACAECKTHGASESDIEAKVGDQLVIQLDSNVTTGYGWVTVT